MWGWGGCGVGLWAIGLWVRGGFGVGGGGFGRPPLRAEKGGGGGT